MKAPAMILTQVDTPEAVARLTMSRIEFWLENKAEPVFALPTGATPLVLYQMLIEACRAGRLDLSRARFFALDEFWGPNVPGTASFAHFLTSRLLMPAGIPVNRLTPLPTFGDATLAGARHEELIEELGGLDLALLGIGGNGHIAFNEPGTPLDSITGLRSLSSKTRSANAYLFASPDHVPVQGITMGISTLMKAREVVLMATGASKAAIIKALRESPVSETIPASVLKRHDNSLVVVDRLAGEALN